MLKIDSHQHFWKYDPINYGWIDDEMSVIRCDFLPADLKPVLDANGIDGCVTVQADQTEEENLFQLKNAEGNDFIKGIVGWVDLRSDAVEERLGYYKAFEKVKGFRHVLQGEKDRSLMLRPAFMNGIRALGKYNYTYDILIFPDQLGYTAEFLRAFPNQKFVIDHIAKPYIKNKRIDDWAKDIKLVARHENVFCKISGMVTETDYHSWKQEDFTPYIDIVVEAFGTERIMFGSDWPVCQVAASYEKMITIVTNYFTSFSKHEQSLFFGKNAAKFYNL